MKKLLSSVSLVCLLSAPGYSSDSASDLFANMLKDNTQVSNLKKTISNFQGLLDDSRVLDSLRAKNKTAEEMQETAEKACDSQFKFNPFAKDVDFTALQDSELEQMNAELTKMTEILDELKVSSSVASTPTPTPSDEDEETSGIGKVPEDFDGLRSSSASIPKPSEPDIQEIIKVLNFQTSDTAEEKGTWIQGTATVTFTASGEKEETEELDIERMIQVVSDAKWHIHCIDTLHKKNKNGQYMHQDYECIKTTTQILYKLGNLSYAEDKKVTIGSVSKGEAKRHHHQPQNGCLHPGQQCSKI